MQVGSIKIGRGLPFVFIAGPCVIESEKLCMQTAEFLSKLTRELDIPFVFKSSYDKANRSSIKSFRGPGYQEGLKILEKVRKAFKVPVLTDIHSVMEAEAAARSVDCLQIPAFLSRQTDLIVAAARTGLPVNIKKAQFMSPWDMKNVVDKFLSTGNDKVLLTERGTCFGYNNLVVDFRSIVVMKRFGYPVIFDASHSVQLPGGAGDSSSGDRQFIFPLAKAAVSLGVDGLFMEVHPDPDKALSDGPNMLALSELKDVLAHLKAIDQAVKGHLENQGSKKKLKIFIDGGSRGNPGKAAIGVYVTSEDGQVLAAVGQTIGVTTNNVAEYKALLCALQKAETLGGHHLAIFSDSELLVKQCSGEYKVKDARLKGLSTEVKEMRARFSEVVLKHIPREKNEVADELVNKALDKG